MVSQNALRITFLTAFSLLAFFCVTYANSETIDRSLYDNNPNLGYTQETVYQGATLSILVKCELKVVEAVTPLNTSYYFKVTDSRKIFEGEWPSQPKDVEMMVAQPYAREKIVVSFDLVDGTIQPVRYTFSNLIAQGRSRHVQSKPCNSLKPVDAYMVGSDK